MEKKENVIVAYKGFDKDLKCRGFQYEFGKEYEEPKAEACECGFHACEYPLDVFGYYPPGSSRYCNVEQSGDIDKRNSDKTCSTKIKIGAEIGIAGLIKAAIEYTKSKCTNEYNAEPGEPATAGEYGAATAGYAGAATAGEYGAATAGNRGAATSRGKSCTGENGVCVARGNNVKVKGGLGSILVIAEECKDNYNLKNWIAVVVDGEKIKADTWYKLVDGVLTECEE